MLPAYYVYAKYMKVDLLKVEKEYVWILIGRAVIGSTTMILIFMAMMYLPVSLAWLIFNVNPIYVTIFAGCTLGEPIRVLNVAAAIGAFVGVTLQNNE
jgi:drug/metabolite transporter (DMT)-like permease